MSLLFHKNYVSNFNSTSSKSVLSQVIVSKILFTIVVGTSVSIIVTIPLW
jgi:hypothetical protein